MSGHRVANIDSLPDALLGRIFVAAGDARAPIALVCKRWRAVCFAEPALWQKLHIVLPQGLFPNGAASEAAWLFGKQWLIRRCGGLVNELRLSTLHHPGTPRSVPDRLLEQLLGEAPSSLQALTLDHSRVLPPGVMDLLPQRFSALQRLAMFGASLPPCAPAALAQLPLASLTLQLDKAPPARFKATLAALSGTLTALQLQCHASVRLPALTSLPFLEECQLTAPGVAFQGHAAVYTRVTMSAAPLRALGLEGARGAPLPQLLAHMQRPAARPLQRLVLVRQAVPAAELAACAPALSGLLELSLQGCSGMPAALEQLLPMVPGLTALAIGEPFFAQRERSQLPSAVLAHTGLRSLSATCLDMTAGLPAAPVMAGLQSLHVQSCDLRQLPAAALQQAAGLTSLSLNNNRALRVDARELLQLLDALPRLRKLNLAGTRAATSYELEAAAKARQVVLLMPSEEDLWSSDEDDYGGGYDSSDFDSSDDGCPRYSWAGCAYASRW